MAILTPTELSTLRQDFERSETPTCLKPTLNAALQAIEDWFEVNRAGLSTTINTATSPYVFTAAQKKKLVAYWLRQKFGREAV